MLCLVRLAKLGQRSQLSDAAPQINKILTAAIPHPFQTDLSFSLSLHSFGGRWPRQIIIRQTDMTEQTEFTLRPRGRGIHLVTGEILGQLPTLPRVGLLNLLIKHTSAALALNENADPDVRHDMNAIFDRLVPENAPFYLHTDEGPDDMPSHAKSVIVGSSLTIPVTNHRLNLGTWQGIYLCEFRDYGGARRIVATVTGD